MTSPKKFRPEVGLTAISGTQPKLAVIAVWGGVWTCAPVSERPEIILSDWQVFEVKLPGLPERTRHFAGQNITDHEGRTSSAINTIDPATGRGITGSGRIYQLRGRPGFTSDGRYVWSRWKSINSVTDVVDVTSEIKTMMELK